MPRHIALIEDEPAIRANYADALRRQGYEVSDFGDRKSSLGAFKRRLPDLAIIDIGLGDEPEGGFELCRELRALSRTVPIIFLTARESDFDVVSGLRLGADDYVTKNASMTQIMARVAALFRRAEVLHSGDAAGEIRRVGDLTLDRDCLRVEWKGRPVDLTVTEFWMVGCLARNPGHVKTRDQLMQEADIFVDDGTVTSHIKRVRRKFQAVDEYFDGIETVYGMGYRWKT